MDATTERDRLRTRDLMNNSEPMPLPDSTRRNDLSDAAIGAVVALIRLAELYDPAVAHRSALRAIVAERLFGEYTAPSLDAPDFPASAEAGVSWVIASAALADIDLSVSRPTKSANPDIPTQSVLTSAIVDSLYGLDGLDAVATSLGQHRERWDGRGLPAGLEGTGITLAARISAVADSLVGNPPAGFVPSWGQARSRVQRQAGTSLDPSLCRALEKVSLDDIAPPAPPSTVIQELLRAAPESQLLETATRTASTIRSAVTSAGRLSELLSLFATSAMTTVRAAEIVILSSSSTQLDAEPMTSVDDGLMPALPQERLDDLYEFSTQAELRAGTTITRTDERTESILEVITPIAIDDDPWGALVATRRSTSTGFDTEDIRALAHIADEISSAVSATEHWADMERMALRDQLTKLGNRHALYRALDDIFLRPPEERIDTALIMCDVDGLKLINDGLGHEAGDRLLIDAADALRGAVRDPERTTVCRIGGDEFCMVIDGGALLNAHEVSSTIERLFERSAGSGPARSISCGIAFADETTTSRSELLRAADENQYETKRARKLERTEREPTATEPVEIDDISAADSLPSDAIDSEAGNRRARRD